MKCRVSWLAPVLIAAFLLVGGAARADTYPSGPIKIIVPFPPGGSSDLLARVVAHGLSGSLGQSVIVENRGGAGTIIGTNVVAKSPHDGYTLAWITTPLAINVTLKNHLPFNTTRDLTPVVMVASIPLVVMVKPSVPAHDIAQLIAYAKKNPKKLSYGSSGPGGTPHLAAEMLKSMAGIDMVHVPYQGSGPVLTALMGGYVDIVIEALQSSAPLINGGKARALATTGSTRSTMFPKLPTMIEAGFPNYQVATWFGLAAPAGTPPAVIDRLNRAIVQILRQPDVKQLLESQGFQLIGDSPGEATAFIGAEISKWAKVVNAAGARESD